MVATATGVVRVGPEHYGILADFYRQTWDSHATEESVRRARAEAVLQNAADPGAEVPTFLFMEGGRAVGHVTTIPFQLWNGREERAAHWLKGLMVLPEYRNGPVGFFLLRQAVEELGTALGFVVRPEVRKLFGALRFRDLGAVPNRILLLRPRAVFEKLDVDFVPVPGLLRRMLASAQSSRPLTGAAGLLLKVGLRLRAAGAGGLAGIVAPDIADAEIDAAWRQMRPFLRAAPARSSAAIRARYLDDGGSRYTAVAVRENGNAAGIGVIRAPATSGDPRLRGLRVATLSECVLPLDRGDVLLGLLRAAESQARQLGADALLCSASHPFLLTRLRRRGYVKIPGNVHLLLRDVDGGLTDDMSQWWLMRGDSHADEVF